MNMRNGKTDRHINKKTETDKENKTSNEGKGLKIKNTKKKDVVRKKPLISPVISNHGCLFLAV